MNECNKYADCAPFLFRGRVGDGVFSFDAWGRRRNATNWSYTLNANDKALFADRGYTGHEHLEQFGLINMNGRLYDPLVGRFLSPDNGACPVEHSENGIQAPGYTQSFNRYGYCWNNPMKYTDPSGDWFLSLIFPPAAPVLIYIDVFLWSATIDWAAQTISNYASKPDGDFSDWAWNEIDWIDVGISGTAGAVTMGLGNLYNAGKISNDVYKIGKVFTNFALPVVSSKYNYKLTNGLTVNQGSDFWNSYMLDVVVTGISAKTGNEIIDGLLSDRPWILNDPLKGDLLKKLLELPLMVGADYLEGRKDLPQVKPIPNPQPEQPIIRPIPNNLNNQNYFEKSDALYNIRKSLIINRF